MLNEDSIGTFKASLRGGLIEPQDEGYAEALSSYLCMPLPPWIADHPHKDNWLAVAKVRQQTEAANPIESVPRVDVAIVERHDF